MPSRYVINKCKLCNTSLMQNKDWCSLKCSLRDKVLKHSYIYNKPTNALDLINNKKEETMNEHYEPLYD